MNNLITIAVLENKPELITNHPTFDVTELREDGCGIGKMPFECLELHCSDCPFGNKDYKNGVDKNGEFENQTIKSMKQWLKLEPLENPTVQPITYTEKEVKDLLWEARGFYKEHKDVPIRLIRPLFREWFNNNKKK